MLNDVKSWLARPYSDDMSVVGWFKFLGLLIVLAAAWGLILRTLSETIDT